MNLTKRLICAILILPHKFNNCKKRCLSFYFGKNARLFLILAFFMFMVYEFVWQFNYTSGKGVLQVNVVEIGKKSAVEYVLHRKICSVIIRRHHLKNKVIHTAYQLTSQALHNRFF